MEYSSFIVRRGSSVSNVLLMLAGELVSSCLCRAILARSCFVQYYGQLFIVPNSVREFDCALPVVCSVEIIELLSHLTLAHVHATRQS